MRYIRFLKTPRLTQVDDKHGRPSTHIHCLITITSDLGDSFLPCPTTLSAELIHASPHDTNNTHHVLVWKTIHWTPGMRSLPVTLPLSARPSLHKWPMRVRISVEPKSECDEFASLLQDDSRGVVSAWSAELDPSQGLQQAEKTVERRIRRGDGDGDYASIRILEETGESIARHLWDAGIAFSCHMRSFLSKAGVSRERGERLRVLELGSGCGIVGITIAQLVPGAQVLLTDLPEAREIISRNIGLATCARDAVLEFQELDWEMPLPQTLNAEDGVDLVVAADCTYNADSSPALVNTLCRVAALSPKVIIAVAMKRRHSSEDVFFDLMREAAFREKDSTAFDLPGDESPGEEKIP